MFCSHGTGFLRDGPQPVPLTRAWPEGWPADGLLPQLLAGSCGLQLLMGGEGRERGCMGVPAGVQLQRTGFANGLLMAHLHLHQD